MILQALVRLYEDLAAQDRIARSGWSRSDITFALCIDADGKLERLVDLRQEVPNGKKMVLRARSMKLPAAVRRAVNIAPNFVWDNSKYLLGIDNDNPDRARKCFESCATLHRDILEGVNSPTAKAILSFFETWTLQGSEVHPEIKEHLDILYSGANLVFRVAGQFAQDDPDVATAWQNYYDGADGIYMQCLVTGKTDLIARIHPVVKGVKGGQSMGGVLVSFKEPAFCSYGREQSYNAPVGKYAAFAYTSALNYLLADKENVWSLGDASVLFWAEGGEPAFQDMMGAMTFGKETGYSEGDLRNMAKKLVEGKPVDFDGTKLDPDTTFYILGISPNAARISVRFFLTNTFGALLKNIEAHYRRTEIIRYPDEIYRPRSLPQMLRETVNKHEKTKQPSPILSGAVARSVFMDTPYPASLLSNTILRIRAEHEISTGKASILKAYYCRNASENQMIQEVMKVELNENCEVQAYVLGRLFAVMEQIQLASAEWTLNRTIKDSYFSSAASTPGAVFNRLFPLSEYHMKKLKRDKRNYAEKLGQEKQMLMGKLHSSIPSRFTLEESSCFYIGYYHQSNKRKKEEA